MSKIFVSLFFLVITFNVFPQATPKTGVQWGNDNRLTMKNYFFTLDIVGRDEGNVYGLQVPGNEVYNNQIGGIKKYHFAKYNINTMDNPQLLELDMKDNDGERDFQFALQIGSEFYAFSSFQNRKLKKTFLFVQTINRKQMTLNSDLKKIAEVDWTNESKYDRANFGLRLSRDKSKIMIRYNLLNRDNEVLRFGFCVFERNFEMLWQYSGLIPVKEGSIFNFKKFYVDNKGDVYLLGVLFQSEKDLAKTNNMRKKSLLSSKRTVQRQPNYTYQLITYTNKGKNVNDYVITEPGKFISDMQIGVNDKQEIILAGFYGAEGMASVKGAYCFKMNKGAKTLGEKSFEPFDGIFITKGMDIKDAKEVLNDMAAGEEFDKYQYSMEDIQFHENGNFSLVAEQFVEESKTVRSGNYVSTEYRYYDDNVIILTFKPNGTFAWKQKVEKNQFSSGVERVYAQFAMLTNKNNMYFVFNEFPDGRPRKSKAVMVKVAQDGSLAKEELFTSTDNKVLQPPTYKQTGEKELSIFAIEKRNYRLARITF